MSQQSPMVSKGTTGLGKREIQMMFKRLTIERTGDDVAKVLGVKFYGKAGESWFFVHAIKS